MKYGLTKIASDYQNDPKWQQLKENLDNKYETFEQARAARNPELVKKENQIEHIGAGTGALLGGLGAAGIGINSMLKAKGARKLLPALFTPTVGMPLGALGGGIMGSIMTEPIQSVVRSAEDPEVLKNVNRTQKDYSRADNDLYRYELENDYESQGY